MSEIALLTMTAANARVAGRLFLRQLDWQLRGGAQWAVLGGNGAGKTLLADILRGTYPLSSGKLTYAPGFDRRRDIAVVSVEEQDKLCAEDARHDISEFVASAVDTGTTVRATILRGRPEDTHFAELCTRLHIEHLLDQGIRFLSSGEIRKTLLAAAVWRRAPLLLLDNPLEGLDRDIAAPVRALLEELPARGQQLLLLARRANDLFDAITHVLVLEQGRLIALGPRTDTSVQRAMAAVQASTEHSQSLPLPRSGAPGLAAEEPLVEFRQVDCAYGQRQVLFDVNCRIGAGQHSCVSGPNGSGKSTMLSLICGDNSRAYGQQLRVFGQRRGDGMSIWELKRRIGIVSNALHRQFPARCRVPDVLVSGFHDSLGLYEAATTRQYEEAHAWLEALQLSGHEQNTFARLSFGDQRLLLIARAVIKRPALLVLDEPCSGLDVPRRGQVLELIDRIAAQGLSTVLFVSHENAALPACIRQHLAFVLDREGRYRLQLLT